MAFLPGIQRLSVACNRGSMSICHNSAFISPLCCNSSSTMCQHMSPGLVAKGIIPGQHGFPVKISIRKPVHIVHCHLHYVIFNLADRINACQTDFPFRIVTMRSRDNIPKPEVITVEDMNKNVQYAWMRCAPVSVQLLSKQ